MENQTNGKDNNAVKAKPKTLDDLWGYKMAKFPTNNLEEYRKKLSIMNKADLQAECLRIHEYPNDDRTRMEEKLLKQFRLWTVATEQTDVQATVIPDNDRTAKARRIIADMTGNAMI